MKTSLRHKGQACNISKFHIMSMVFRHYAYMYLYIESICYWYVFTYALTLFCFLFWNNFYAELNTALPLHINIILIASNENIDFMNTNRIIHYMWLTFYTLRTTKLLGGILVSLRPSICSSVRPASRVRSVAHSVLVGSILINTSYQTSSESVSRVNFFAKCKKLIFWQFLQICNFGCLYLTWDLMLITSMGNNEVAGGISERRRSSCSSFKYLLLAVPSYLIQCDRGEGLVDDAGSPW